MIKFIKTKGSVIQQNVFVTNKRVINRIITVAVTVLLISDLTMS